MNLCHDCITLIDEDGCTRYNGPSVDEVCLLEMCHDSGLGEFKKRDATSYKISVRDEIETYQILKVFEFTSERKAMSVIVKHPSKVNRAICFVKGADSAIFPLCSGKSEEVERSVEAMAKKGLRTLLYASKEIYWDG